MVFGVRRRKEPPTGPYYKQRGWVLSAMFLALLLVLSSVALLTGDRTPSGASAGRTVLAGVRGPLSPGDPLHVRRGPGGRPADCRTDDRDTARPSRAPSDVRWKQLGPVMVPVSPSAGPLRTDGTMRWCFAHTPAGAVVAAHVIPVELSLTGQRADWRTAVEQQVVPGKRRDLFVEREDADDQDPGGRTTGRYTGFSVQAYSGRAATVRLLLSNPLGGYVSTSVSLRWRDGDWKVTPEQDGSLYSSVKAAEPSGFVMWSS